LHCAQCVDDKFDTLPDNELPEKELTVLLDHFGVPKTVVPEPAAFFSEETESKFSPFHTSKRSVSKTFPALVVSEKAKDEFEMFKSHMFSSFAEYTEFDDKGQIVPLSFVEFVKRNKSSLQARFPEIFTLMQLALVLPLTSVPCECGFSKMKLIKSAMRSKMGTEVLDHLMRISCATISCVDFGIKFGVKRSKSWICFFSYETGACPQHYRPEPRTSFQQEKDLLRMRCVEQEGWGRPRPDPTTF